jgi:hypothetical protein
VFNDYNSLAPELHTNLAVRSTLESKDTRSAKAYQRTVGNRV